MFFPPLYSLISSISLSPFPLSFLDLSSNSGCCCCYYFYCCCCGNDWIFAISRPTRPFNFKCCRNNFSLFMSLMSAPTPPANRANWCWVVKSFFSSLLFCAFVVDRKFSIVSFGALKMRERERGNLILLLSWRTLLLRNF